ncbi:hypothetical protein HFP71_16925 [Streptomyces sp. ARC32]
MRLREDHGAGTDAGTAVYLRYETAGTSGHERFDLQAVVLKADRAEPLSGRTWRRIPFSDLEMHFQIPDVRGVLAASSATPAPSLDELDRYFDETTDDAKVVAMVPSGRMYGDGTPESPEGELPTIRRPEGRLTDEFLADVAQAYRWLSAAGQAPAPVIVDMADAPVRTVHRWIYEARKRGVLPPARSGRAG